MQLTRKCAECKESFRKTEMKEYQSLTGKTTLWFCPACYEKKMERERFANTVRKLFGIVSPGPQIWTERKRLFEKYGYDDATIIDCLEYLYKIEKKQVLSESLCLVKPPAVERMKKWKQTKQNEGQLLNAAIEQSQQMKEYIVPQKKEKVKTAEILNADDFLEE